MLCDPNYEYPLSAVESIDQSKLSSNPTTTTMTTLTTIMKTLFTLSLLLIPCARAFLQPSVPRPVSVSSRPTHSSAAPVAAAGALLAMERSTPQEDDSLTRHLFKDFQTSWGEVLEPYEILNVPRSATRRQVKHAYYKLSRKYHPDGARHRSNLPGSCNNKQDMEDHWERIKLSYEILSSKRIRCRYDRCEFFADPGAVVQRAAANALSKGLEQVGNSIWNLGDFTVQHIVQDSMTVASHVAEKAKKDIDELKSLAKNKQQALQSRRQPVEEGLARGFGAITNSVSLVQPKPSSVEGLARGLAINPEAHLQTAPVAEEVARGFVVASPNPNASLHHHHPKPKSSPEGIARGFAINLGSPLKKRKAITQGVARGFAINRGSPPKRHKRRTKPKHIRIQRQSQFQRCRRDRYYYA